MLGLIRGDTSGFQGQGCSQEEWSPLGRFSELGSLLAVDYAALNILSPNKNINDWRKCVFTRRKV